MDFVTGLPQSTEGYDSVWVIVDRLTKSADFLPLRTKFTVSQYAQLYLDKIVRLHRIPA